MPKMERIDTPDAPSPAGHYAQATAWRDLVFISGQLPLRWDGTHLVDAPFEDQAHKALANLLAILKKAGSDPEHVLRLTAYVVSIENWPGFNQVFAAAFGASKPARAIVPTPELHFGYLVEIEAVATRALHAGRLRQVAGAAARHSPFRGAS